MAVQTFRPRQLASRHHGSQVLLATFPTMKTITTFFALFALVAGALAQEDPAKLQLAKEVVALMQADKMFDGVAAQMKQVATQAASNPGAGPEERARLEALQGKIMEVTKEYFKGLVAKMDGIYADVYSVEELKAMKAFYGSPEGQSMLTKQPKVMQAMMPFMQEMQRDLGPKIQDLVNEAKASGKSKVID